MAKIDQLELNVNGSVHKININVGKSGVFSCQLPWDVAQTLGLQGGKFANYKLDELKRPILEKYHAFLESSKTETLHIFIVYRAAGKYKKKKDGQELFYAYRRDYVIDTWGTDLSQLCFYFKVYIKEEHSTGAVGWFTAESRDGGATWSKDRSIHKSPEGKGIPYSEEALATLEKASEGIRSISEILFNFIDQEPTAIAETLLGGNLLN